MRRPRIKNAGKTEFYVIGQYAFVRHPELRIGLIAVWFRTHASIAIRCPDCGSNPGVLCQNAKTGRWTISTHYMRRAEYSRLVGQPQAPEDLVE